MKDFPLAFLLAMLTVSASQGLPTGFNYKVLFDGLDLVSSAVLPDGRVLAVEKKGKISLLDQKTGAKSTALDWVANTWSNYEAGMTQVLPDPGFAANGYLYIQYCKKAAVNGEDHDWVGRFTMKGNVIDPASEAKIMDLGFRGPNYHHGGGLGISPKDGMLYINCGSRRSAATNQNQPELAVKTGVIFGKVLRVKIPSGEIPADNPYYAANTGDARAVYYSGLRNPFTMAFHPVTGAHWIVDIQDASSEDEMNLGGPAGTGYGYGGGSGAQGPMFTAGNSGGGGGAQVGVLFYTGGNFPAAYKDKVFVGQVRGFGGNLKVMTPGSKTPETFGPFNIPNGLASEYNPIDIKMDAAGAIYVSTRFQTENVQWTKGRVIKVWYGAAEPELPTTTLEDRLNAIAGLKMHWSRIGPGRIAVTLRDGGRQKVELKTLDGRILASRTMDGEGSLELRAASGGIHILTWSDGRIRGAVRILP